MRVALAAMVSALTFAALSSVVSPSLQAQRAVPRVDSTVPFKVGETLTFDVSFSSFMVAGTAVATVRERRPSASNASAYYIVAEGRPLPLIARLYSLYYKMDTLLDTATLLPQEGSLYSEEGRRQRMGTTRYDRAARKAFFELQGDPPIRADVNVPAQVQDGLSALYAMRATNLTAGTKLTYPILDDGALYTVAMQAASTERIKVPLGDLEAWNMKVSINRRAGPPGRPEHRRVDFETTRAGSPSSCRPSCRSATSSWPCEKQSKVLSKATLGDREQSAPSLQTPLPSRFHTARARVSPKRAGSSTH